MRYLRLISLILNINGLIPLALLFAYLVKVFWHSEYIASNTSKITYLSKDI